MMPLAVALKNRETVVIATDSVGPADGTITYGQFMNVPGHAVLLLIGNIEAIRRPIMELVVPKLGRDTGAAILAQLVQAALVLEVVPQLALLKGRVEVIVAGIDPVRHIKVPSLYYLDSSQDFYLKAVAADYVAAGSTAVVGELLGGRDLGNSSSDTLIELAKDCLATTKMRWPAALAAHQRIAVISPDLIRILDF